MRDAEIGDINSAQIVRHSSNADKAIDYSAVKWTGNNGGENCGLKTANGADGYNATTRAWHLDDYLTVKFKEKFAISVNFSYCDKDQTKQERPALHSNVS